TEKADRLLGVISESRQVIFDDIRSLEYKSIAGFVLFALFVSLVYYKRVFSPVEKAARTARRVSTGIGEARFSEDSRSLLGRLGRELNAMLETLARERSALKAANSSLKERLAEEGLRIRAFSNLMSRASNSLSQNDVLNVALNEAASGTGADAGAVFVMEEGELRLRASYGFGSAAPRELQQASAAVLNGMEKSGYGGVFNDIRGYPDRTLGEFLKSRGFESLLCLPISYNRETLGCFLVIFKGEIGDAEAKLPFVEALARGAAVSIGHAGLFQGEYNARRFVERVIHQMPFGVAVFDEKGSCRLLNTALKKMLGAEKADLAGYGILEDEALASRGMLAPVKKAYEGYAAEFIINYNPADIKRFNLSGPQRRLKVRSFPLFDAGGDISNIVVLYEELPGAPGEPAARTGDAP
ncbi:MAG: PAS domain-containing protein, partial [Deltaproteobacteria bacterium]|nr:PAS domain-containing protein [Deltaproteobacteria bacterium]